jgi:PKD repeat protein
VTVTALSEAPGTTAALAEAFGRVAASLDTLLAVVPVASPAESHARAATFELLRALTVDGDASLLALAEGRSALAPEGIGPREAELVDALLASSGALAYAHALDAALSEAVSRHVRPSEVWASTGPIGSAAAWGADASSAGDDDLHALATFTSLCRGEGDDFDLACRMQVQAVLADFTEAFVRPTASTYANTVGLAAGLTAIAATGGAALPFAAVVGAILGVAEFAMTKIVPAMLPSRVDRFELVIDDPVIGLNAMTVSTVIVSAVNDPPPISLFEVMERIYSTLGLSRAAQPRLAERFDEILRNTARFVFSEYGRVLRSLDAALPGGMPGVGDDDFRVPLLHWGPVAIVSDDLVTLFSFDEEVVASREPELEWQGVLLGEATVRVVPRGPGERSTVLVDGALCPGCTYHGGAFGIDMPAATERVVVGRLDLVAAPDRGVAPLVTTFSWHGLPSDHDEPLACTLDPGDGTTPYQIDDCAGTTTQAHTYPVASAVRTESGSYRATLDVTGHRREATADVLADWAFTATPSRGVEPLEVTFDWRGFDAGEPLSCLFEPGDGTPARTVDDCTTVTSQRHRFEASGGYSPTLIVTGPARQDLKDVAVDVSAEDPVCAVARDAVSWRAHVTMAFELVHRSPSATVTIERRVDLELELGDRGGAHASVWWRVLDGNGTASIVDTLTSSASDRTQRIHASGPPWRVGGGLSMRADDCQVTRLEVSAHAQAANDTVGGSLAPATVGYFALHGPALSGTATLPVYQMPGGSQQLGEDIFALATGANFTENFGMSISGVRFDEQVGSATVSWNLVPSEVEVPSR